MTTVTRGAAVVPAGLAAAVVLAVLLAGCGGLGVTRSSQRAAPGEEPHTIGLLLSDSRIARWEHFDRPLIEQRVEELCRRCSVDTVNAEGQVRTQLQQMNAMITRGVRSLIVDPVDNEAIRSAVEWAHAAGIPVVSYDRLAQGPISGYASHDNERVGRLQGQALLDALGERADRPRVVMVNGSPTDPNTKLLQRGALSVLSGRVDIVRSYATADWSPEAAYANMTAAIADLGADRIDAVYSANDGIAAGVLAALRTAHLDPPPLTGQDAELAAVQRVVTGKQYMTVYKPYRPEAFAAAEMAVALGRGEPLDAIATDMVSNATERGVPAVLVAPIPVTADDVENTVVKDGLFTVDQICTPRFASACSRVGLR